MTNKKLKSKYNGHRIILILVLCLFGLCIAQSRSNRQRRVIGDNRVYLIHADVLHYNQVRNPEAQILNGHVSFKHRGARMLCDSAYFYQASNSFEAFGHVRMLQGDTLSLKSDYAYYDGNEQMAMARRNVLLTHRKSKLYTDSLNFDRLYNVGYFFEGGKLVDEKNVLTSDWGQYNTETREAIFNYNVKLKNPKFYLTTDTLHYSTKTAVANIVGPSHIKSGDSRIYTESGFYNSRTDKSRLYGRSLITNKDRTIVGDSVYYDSKRKICNGYGNVIYTDKKNKNMFKSDYGYYNEKTGFGMATKKALAIDYSQKDTLYMHADTFKIYTYNINTDSMYRKMHAYHKVRAYRIDVQGVCDSLVYNSKDSCMTMYKDPIVWNQNQQLLGEQIKVYANDSTIKWAHVINNALSVQQMPDNEHFNQVSSIEMKAFFKNGDINKGESIKNVRAVYYPQDDSDSSLIGLNYTETDTMKMYLQKRQLQKIWMPAATGTLYPMSQIPPSKKFLPDFEWFDYVRPLNKNDIFVWRGKKSGTELKKVERREVPLQTFKRKSKT
ncbi:OstA-like protein [Xylanibacter oryzae]|uniref:OstA-like protein n=1 Tax=Xylanibacter oryzae TaxID=185293 RepID=UPI000561EA2F|nr:OstA-like protein [Xylanibacter oryzae]MBP7358149.1 hypothetical protein [Prevotella sp.]